MCYCTWPSSILAKFDDLSFSKIKSVLKGTHFESADTGKETADILKQFWSAPHLWSVWNKYNYTSAMMYKYGWRLYWREQ